MDTGDATLGTMAPAAGPPSPPHAWANRDGRLRTQLVLRAETSSPYQGTPPCHCGGAWRYTLRAGERHPVWRCLHCGALYQGATPIAED